jgi:hypothetical protein
MTTKIRVLLHTSSFIVQDHLFIVGTTKKFGYLTLGKTEGLYRDLLEYTKNIQSKDAIEEIGSISFQAIANEITSFFGCPTAIVSYPKVTPRGVFVTYSRGELERNMLFLKVVLEESI